MRKQNRKLLEVLPDCYVRVKRGAKKSGRSVKLYSTMLMEYALDRVDSGQATEVQPGLEDKREVAA